MADISNKVLGDRGEVAAKLYLESLDYKILERKWQSGHGQNAGEADLIALDKEELVFVEVKTRAINAESQPSGAVDKRKRAKYANIAAQYLIQRQIVNCDVRFDVVSILMSGPNRATLKHYKNAYYVDQVA